MFASYYLLLLIGLLVTSCVLIGLCDWLGSRYGKVNLTGQDSEHNDGYASHAHLMVRRGEPRYAAVLNDGREQVSV